VKIQQPASLREIEMARQRLSGLAIRSPLIKLDLTASDSQYNSNTEIFLKLENLQPTGAFKVRCQANVIKAASPTELGQGVFTASSGNSGTAMAWVARKLDIPARVYAPDNAPESKLQNIRALGAVVHKLPYEKWWEIVETGCYADEQGFFANPVNSPAAIAGNATIGLEIYEDMPDVDTVVLPFGGGGLSCGVASAFRALQSTIRTYGAESCTALPLAAAFREGEPVIVPHRDCFISGIGVATLLPDMWPLAQQLLAGAVAADLTQISHAIRLLFERHHIVVEGAGAVALAAALTGQAGTGKIVCVISGGNLDGLDLVKILRGEVPR
jgi:threonine dehydratase